MNKKILQFLYFHQKKRKQKPFFVPTDFAKNDRIDSKFCAKRHCSRRYSMGFLFLLLFFRENKTQYLL